ncbi:MAG: hypothetical protein JKY91_01930, partial [Emcibacter sp.]|nr:hypothetical protein [Emcibacter sp.]
MTEQHLKTPLKRDKNSSNWALKVSITSLTLVAVAAVVWILFFAEDGGSDFFTSEPLQALSVEEAVPSADPLQQAQVPDRISSILPSFDIVRISRNGTGVIAGRAEPNSDISIYAHDKVIGSAVADRNGEWVLL